MVPWEAQHKTHDLIDGSLGLPRSGRALTRHRGLRCAGHDAAAMAHGRSGSRQIPHFGDRSGWLPQTADGPPRQIRPRLSALAARLEPLPASATQRNTTTPDGVST